MKKIILAITLLSAFIFLSGNVFAAGAIKSNKINYVAFQTGGFFMYADDWGNPNSCSQSGAILLSANDPNYDKAYALLLSAYMSGKKVNGYSDGCDTFDGQTYNRIRGYKYLIVRD